MLVHFTNALLDYNPVRANYAHWIKKMLMETQIQNPPELAGIKFCSVNAKLEKIDKSKFEPDETRA